MAAEDWDLFAVVRSCSSAVASSSTAGKSGTDENPLGCLASLSFEDDEEDPFRFPNLEQPKYNAFEELNQLYKPFSVPADFGGFKFSGQRLPKQEEQPENMTSSSSSSLLGDSRVIPKSPSIRVQQKPEELPQQQQEPAGPLVPILVMPPPPQGSPRLRKRKIQQKRMVCEVTAENLSSDLWAWRKYGQKPIKGSPYPRNYYRCSSSKGCSARKQVEKSTTDPKIFMVTYTGEHNHPRPTHRNSLAGSTRNKLSSPPPTTSPDDDIDDVATENEDEDDLLIPNLALTEDIFVGLQELGYGTPAADSGPSGSTTALGDEFSRDHRTPKLEPPWTAASSSGDS